MPTDFADMDEAEVEPLWASFDGTDVVIESDDEELERTDEALVGVLMNVREGSGQYGSTVYEIRTEDHERPVCFWGTGHIDNQIQNSPVSVHDEIGIKPTDDVLDTGEGEAMQVFDVRYNRTGE